jgi:hypothetical protein
MVLDSLDGYILLIAVIEAVYTFEIMEQQKYITQAMYISSQVAKLVH